MENLTRLFAALREFGYYPYRIVTLDGQRVEIISMPFERNGAVLINARVEVGDPTTIREYVLLPAVEDASAVMRHTVSPTERYPRSVR